MCREIFKSIYYKKNWNEKKIEHFHQNLKKTLSYTNILHSNGQIAAENIISKIFQTFSESSSPWKSDWSVSTKMLTQIQRL